MPQKFMDVLMLGRCSHEFSWPRRGTWTATITRSACSAPRNTSMTGQPCAELSAWSTPRRRRAIAAATRARSGRSWVPRARRLKLDIPLRYRVNKTSTWHEGIIENISQSGVLFNGPQQLPMNALIEMVFEMPEGDFRTEEQQRRLPGPRDALQGRAEVRGAKVR
jgi:hypothetical protein